MCMWNCVKYTFLEWRNPAEMGADIWLFEEKKTFEHFWSNYYSTLIMLHGEGHIPHISYTFEMLYISCSLVASGAPTHSPQTPSTHPIPNHKRGVVGVKDPMCYIFLKIFGKLLNIVGVRGPHPHLSHYPRCLWTRPHRGTLA